MIVKVMRSIKASGIKLPLPIRKKLAKAHLKMVVDHDFMMKLGAKYLHSGGCKCCYTSSIYMLGGFEIEVALGYLWSIPLAFMPAKKS